MLRLRHLAVSLPLFAAFVLFVCSPQPVQAKYTGGDPPVCRNPRRGPIPNRGTTPGSGNSPSNDNCLGCGIQRLPTYSFVSLTEGNFAETYSGPVAKSALGPTLGFDLIYNSYNADGTRA